jgi:hypothetical protein
MLTKKANDFLTVSAINSLARGTVKDNNPYMGDPVYSRQILARKAIQEGMMDPKPSLLAHLAGGAAVGAVAAPVASSILAHRLPPHMAEKVTTAFKGRHGLGIGAGIGLVGGYLRKQQKDQSRQQAQDYLSYISRNRKQPMPIAPVKTASDSVDDLAKAFKRSLNQSGKAVDPKDKAFQAKRESSLSKMHSQAKSRPHVGWKPSMKGKALVGLGVAATVGAGVMAKKKYDDLTKIAQIGLTPGEVIDSAHEKTASVLSKLLSLTTKKAPVPKTTVKVNTKSWRVPGVPTGSNPGSAFDQAVKQVEPRLDKIGSTLSKLKDLVKTKSYNVNGQVFEHTQDAVKAMMAAAAKKKPVTVN